MSKLTHRSTIFLTAFFLSALAPDAFAQLLDNVKLSQQGDTAVITLSFNTAIQYMRHSPASSGELIKLEVQVVGDASDIRDIGSEARRVDGQGVIPDANIIFGAGQARSLVKLIQFQFARPVSFKMGPGNDNRSITLRLPIEAGTTKPITRDETTPVRYAIVLEQSDKPIEQNSPLPSAADDFTLFNERLTDKGTTLYRLSLGYFDTQTDAQKFLPMLTRAFPQARIEKIGDSQTTVAAVIPQSKQGETSPSLPTAPLSPLAVPPEIASPTPAQLSPDEIEKQSAMLLASARSAINAKDYTNAIQTLNQLLQLPPSSSSEAAQSLVGRARENNGEYNKARAEYELYIKLYPSGIYANEVRKRLDSLGTSTASASTNRARGSNQRLSPIPFTAGGSVSQYYYRGSTQSETRVVNATTIDKASFSGTDQSSLVSNVDLNARWRSETTDNRLVFRDSYTRDFLTDGHNRNRLTAAYYDMKNAPTQINARIGRQSSPGGGVLGRMDGLNTGYQFAQKWKANIILGSPHDDYVKSTRTFAGTSLDAGTFDDHWSGSTYFITQRIDGITDRRAAGSEVRFFSESGSAYSLVDYDMYYKAVNIFMLQGSYTSGANTWNVLLDRRMTPALQSSNALIGSTIATIDELKKTTTINDIKAQARDHTAVAEMAFAGVTRQLTDHWQVGVDLRDSRVGALPATADLPATTATGDVYNINFQVIGSNLYKRQDITAFNVGVLRSRDYKGYSLSLSNLGVYWEKWVLEPSLRYYRQLDVFQTRLRRITPGMRVTYRRTDGQSFELDSALEDTKTNGPTQSEDTTRYYISAGYRLDF